MIPAQSKLQIYVFVAGRPVSINSAFGQRGNRRFLTSAAEVWKNAVTWTVYSAWPDFDKLYNYLAPRPKKVAVAYRFQGVKGDADNYLKLVNDAIAVALRNQ